MINLRVVKAASRDPGITVIQVANFEAWQEVATRRTPDAPPDARIDAPPDAPPLHATHLATNDLFVPPHVNDAPTDAPSDAGGVFKPTRDIINNKKESKILRFQPKAKGQSTPSSEDLLAWPSDAFDKWYRTYPRKKAPKDARRALDKLQVSDEIAFQHLITATQRFAAGVATWPPERRHRLRGSMREATPRSLRRLQPPALQFVIHPRSATATGRGASANFTAAANGAAYGGRNRALRDAGYLHTFSILARQ
jgi:hypothetical protein